MSEADYDKNEQKISSKLETKFLEIKEQMRMDRNDYNSKLATFKADVSMLMFDKKTFNFLKDRVYTEWQSVISKNKEREELFETMKTRSDRLTKKLNQALE